MAASAECDEFGARAGLNYAAIDHAAYGGQHREVREIRSKRRAEAVLSRGFGADDADMVASAAAFRVRGNPEV